MSESKLKLLEQEARSTLNQLGWTAAILIPVQFLQNDFWRISASIVNLIFLVGFIWEYFSLRVQLSRLEQEIREREAINRALADMKSKTSSNLEKPKTSPKPTFSDSSKPVEESVPKVEPYRYSKDPSLMAHCPACGEILRGKRCPNFYDHLTE